MFVPLYDCNSDQMLVGPQASLITLKCSEHPDWKLATTDRPRDKHCHLGMPPPQKKVVIFHDFCHYASDPTPLNGTFFHPFFYPTFFLLQLNLREPFKNVLGDFVR